MKGVFVEISSSLGAVPNIIPFQFNPNNITRTLSPREGFWWEPEFENRWVTVNTPILPSETISMNIQLDATDKLSEGNQIAGIAGIQPALSAIELMMYPKEIPTLMTDSSKYPPMRELPLILLVLGMRIYPINITNMTITEQAFDINLNPIRAEIQISLQVLNSDDKNVSDIAKSIFKYTKKQKEVIAP